MVGCFVAAAAAATAGDGRKGDGREVKSRW